MTTLDESIIQGQLGHLADHEALHALNNKVGQPNGIAELGADGKLKAAQSATITTQALGVESRPIEVQTATAAAGRGKYVFSVQNTTFLGDPDPNLYVGYNLTAGGTRILEGEPGLAWALEAYYNDGSGAPKMEQYTQYVAPSGSTHKRGLFFQWNRNTNALSNVTLMGTATVGVNITYDDGTVQGTPVVQLNKQNSRFLAPDNTSDNTVSLDAATGRTSSLQLGLGAAASPTTGLKLATVTTNESRITQAGRDILYIFSTPIGAAGQAVAIGVQDNTAVLTAAVSTSNTGVKGIVVRGRASQAANLFEAQASDGTTIYTTISENGYFTTRKTAAPADAELVAGEMALWFDSTNGAAKLMVKAKEAGGTVRTASVALA